MIRRCFLAAIVAFVGQAQAFAFDNCAVGEIVFAGEFNAHVQLSCEVAGRPACATAGAYVGFDKSTAAGNHWLAAFMPAQARGSVVTGHVNVTVCSPHQGNVALLTYLRLR